MRKVLRTTGRTPLSRQFLPFLPELPESSQAWSAIQDDQEVAAGVKFAEHFSNLTRLLRKTFPAYEHLYNVVITPFGEESRRTIVAQSPYLLINPRQFVEGIEKDKLRISEKILAVQLYPYTRLYQKQSGSVFKIGLELFLLEQAYPEELPEILGVTEKRLAALQKQLPKFKERMGAGKRLKDDERRYLSLAFARALAARYPFQGVLKASPRDIVKKLVEYLHPPSERPTPEQNSEGSQGKKRTPLKKELTD